MRAIRSLQDISALRIAALLYLLFALVVTAAGKFPLLAEFVPEPLLHTFLPNDKENIAPYRVIHFLALAFLFTLAVPRDWRGFKWGILLAMHVLVSISGISIMTAVAYYASWSKRQDYKPALSTRP
jgi:hypothetical protein